jgi:transcriptional regulator with XRE-family HTH domain
MQYHITAKAPMQTLHPLKQWRLTYGVSQQEMERRCGISQGQISAFEHFRQLPMRDVLERLRTYTGLPTDALVRPQYFLLEQPDFLLSTRPPTREEVC